MSRGGRPKSLQEGAGGVPVGGLDGAFLLGYVGEGFGDGAGILLAGAGDLAKDIGEDLGLERADRVAGEVGWGVGVAVARDRGKLVSPRVEDQPADVLEVVVTGDELPLQVGQQRPFCGDCPAECRRARG